MASREIVDFMLGQPSSPAADAPASHSSIIETPTNTIRNHAAQTPRRNRSVWRDWCKTVAAWVHQDDQLGSILSSIANLQERLYNTTKFQAILNQQQQQDPLMIDHQQGIITVEDLELAINHDLRAHERMLGQLRVSMSELSKLQDSLGRRLDALYKEESPQGIATAQDEGGHAVVLCAALARELYRKQQLVQMVLDSAIDSKLLYTNSSLSSSPSVPTTTSSSPRQATRTASEEWPRHYPSSHLSDDDTRLLLQSIVDRHGE